MTLNMTTKSNATLDILCNNNSSLNTNSTTNNVNQDDNLCEDMMMGEAPKILKLADIGYSISLITLVLALIILTCVRRLRSPRNNLHLQLFISFIIRCSLHLIKRLFLEQMYMVSLNNHTNEAYCKLILNYFSPPVSLTHLFEHFFN